MTVFGNIMIYLENLNKLTLWSGYQAQLELLCATKHQSETGDNYKITGNSLRNLRTPRKKTTRLLKNI